ncbi:MAG: hypothetical protein HQ567_05665 [Candidatus Nealsonbacteria bacterium]|nr:hypothetical protein [Candidatus Nealsonbacteria bacterium]
MSGLQFWPDFATELDPTAIATLHVPVKGVEYHNPGRFIEVYDGTVAPSAPTVSAAALATPPTDEETRASYFVLAPGSTLRMGPDVPQPPFAWRQCSGQMMIANFIYNTNAIYRILHNLDSQARLPGARLDALLDSACQLLSHIYKSYDYGVIRYINNNVNMCLVSRVIEHIVGRSVYDACAQEPIVTRGALRAGLGMAREHTELSTTQLMSLALGKGVAFVESSLAGQPVNRSLNRARDIAHSFVDRPLAIDDRHLLIERIDCAATTGSQIRMCAVLDDTAESVDDLLWIQSLVREYRNLTVDLLLNKAQVSVNFTASMMDAVLRAPEFSVLASLLGEQVVVTETFCPLISFQSNALDSRAHVSIENSDFLFVKGMNFFETLQLPHKDVFYSFVVCGPIARMLTGLREMDGVFCLVPKGQTGYRFGTSGVLKTLSAIRHRAEA